MTLQGISSRNALCRLSAGLVFVTLSPQVSASELPGAIVEPAQISGERDPHFRLLFSRWRSLEQEQPVAAVISVSRAGDGLGAPLVWRNSLVVRPFVASALGRGNAQQPGLPVRLQHQTSGYGMRRDPFGGGRRMHSGVDLAVPFGSPVYAPSAGIVSHAAWRGGYGLLIAVEHGSGFQTRFGHLSSVAVVPGQHVKKGDLLGQVGSTGRSTGPHLHYELRVGGISVNPFHNNIK